MSIDLGPEIRAGMGSVRGLAQMLGVTERVAARIILSGMADYAASSAAADTEVAVAIAGSISGWAVLLIILMVVAILELVAFIAHVIVTPLSWIPLGFGPRIARAVESGFVRPFDSVISLLNQAAAAVVRHFVHQMVQWVGWAGRESGLITRSQARTITTTAPSTGGSTSTTLRAQVANLENETTHLQQEIDSIEYRLDHPANGTRTAPQVWTQIHALQRSVATMNRAMISIQTQVHTIEDRQTSLEHRMATLASQLHGISAVAVTWQDIAHQVDMLGNQVTNLANQTAQDLVHQEKQITQLAPLGLLLQPGVAGLKVLRSLEDRPCQCPEFGNVPNWLGTALAVEDFVANG